MLNNEQTPELATGNNSMLAGGITDKKGYALRWSFSTRKVDDLLQRGLPHLKIGSRRVRIMTQAADQWMLTRYGTQRGGAA